MKMASALESVLTAIFLFLQFVQGIFLVLARREVVGLCATDIMQMI